MLITSLAFISDGRCQTVWGFATTTPARGDDVVRDSRSKNDVEVSGGDARREEFPIAVENFAIAWRASTSRLPGVLPARKMPQDRMEAL